MSAHMKHLEESRFCKFNHPILFVNGRDVCPCGWVGPKEEEAEYPKCKSRGCDELTVKESGFCESHHDEFVTRRAKKEQCLIAECKNPTQQFGYCLYHQEEMLADYDQFVSAPYTDPFDPYLSLLGK